MIRLQNELHDQASYLRHWHIYKYYYYKWRPGDEIYIWPSIYISYSPETLDEGGDFLEDYNNDEPLTFAVGVSWLRWDVAVIAKRMLKKII